MRITIITIGSRGDVQLYVALGRGLQREGHSVLLATHAEFEPFVRSYGLNFALLEGNPRAVLESDTGREWQKSGTNPLLFLQHFRRIARPLIQQLTSDCLHACQDADLVLFSVLGFYPAFSVVEKLRVPACAAYLQPATPTRAFATYRLPPAPGWLLWGRGVYNKASYTLMEQLYWQALREPINEARRSVLGLAPRKHPPKSSRQLRLYGYSKHALPAPTDWHGHSSYVTGYWFLEKHPDWQPSSELLRFLAGGPPPVYVGFGSMNNRDAKQVTETVLEALKIAKQRAILVTGWGGLSDIILPEDVFKIESVPFDWLFPRVTTVVHHGGAGTTAEGLRAGIPSVVIPFFSDQPFWAQSVYELGVGPKPIPRQKLTSGQLAHAISITVNDVNIRARANTLGRHLRSEDGVRNAVSLLRWYYTSERSS
jgi:sterol 3beta-glucosyltransferase